VDNKVSAGENPGRKSMFWEEAQMKDFDFGYFGTGNEGYAQYMTAFDRTFGSDSADSDVSSSDDFSDNGGDEDF